MTTEGFTACDMASQGAQGFRDGVASVAADIPTRAEIIKLWELATRETTNGLDAMEYFARAILRDNTAVSAERDKLRAFAQDTAMTKEYAIEKLVACQQNYDTETAHADADDVLCELLKSLGYADVVAEYRKVDKWFA